MAVFSPELTGEELKKGVAWVEKLVVDLKGKVKKTTHWGKKDLNYPVNGCTQGHFYLYQLELTPESLSEAEKKLRGQENILRYLLVRS